MSYPNIAQAEDAISFGSFHLLPTRQLLLEGDKPVRIGSRALDILIVLIERAGQLVGKDELIARVWPGLYVEEGTLRVHISALRKTLGGGGATARYFVNIPGRGYQFVAPTSLSMRHDAPAKVSAETTHHLPAILTRVVGRDDILESLCEQFQRRRLITIVGAGGIGKTTVALATAERIATSLNDGARFIDLGPIADPQHVPSLVASMLGIAVHGETATPAVVDFLKNKQMLLVLDNCEHVIDAAASLAEEIMRNAPDMRILATSREPLRAREEHVRRLGSLAVPSAAEGLTAAEALIYPAVQLFVERAAASLDGFELRDEDAPKVAEICRALDGIALAIEIAVSRIDSYGVGGLASLIDDRFRSMVHGQRTALPRHQTLNAALDWSHELLPEAERIVLRRLSVFAGDFTLESAGAVAAGAEISARDVVDYLANLATKSLVSADVSGLTVQYRLLTATRAYVLEKLRAKGEFETTARRHAEHFLAIFSRAEAEADIRPAAEWLAEHGRHINDVRIALDWAASVDEAEIGASLTSASVPLWTHMSLLGECRRRVEKALSGLKLTDDAGEEREMKLFAALANALVATVGPGPDAISACLRALAIAERIGNIDYQLRALLALWNGCFTNSDMRTALILAEKFFSVAEKSNSSADLLVARRLIAVTQFLHGDVASAREHMEKMLAGYATVTNDSHMARFVFGQQASARGLLAAMLIYQGFTERSLALAALAEEEVLSTGHALSICGVIGTSCCTTALYAGDLETAERQTAILRDQATRHDLSLWLTMAHGFEGVLMLMRGDLAGGLRVLSAVLDENIDRSNARYMLLFCEYAGALGRSGDAAGGLEVIEDVLERILRNEGLWYVAELLRYKALLLLMRDGAAAHDAAESIYTQALEYARKQGAASWELRTATSFAQLRLAQGRPDEARMLLTPVYARFTEGFERMDLKAARVLLDQF